MTDTLPEAVERAIENYGLESHDLGRETDKQSRRVQREVRDDALAALRAAIADALRAAEERTLDVAIRDAQFVAEQWPAPSIGRNVAEAIVANLRALREKEGSHGGA